MGSSESDSDYPSLGSVRPRVFRTQLENVLASGRFGRSPNMALEQGLNRLFATPFMSCSTFILGLAVVRDLRHVANSDWVSQKNC